MHAYGVKQTAYFNAMVSEKIPLYQEAANAGYFVMKCVVYRATG